MTKKKQIENLRTRLVSRGWSLTKMGLKAGGLAAGQALKGAFSSAEAQKSAWGAYVLKQMTLLTNELGQLKGSAMKMGQLLSMYGEHFLPKEANDLLKSLQSNSPALSWSAIRPVLEREIQAARLAELDIDPTPWAAASIGQVHRARRRSDGQELALKIQYPGADAAIETDLKFLRTILAMGPLLPKGPKFDSIFDEVRTMLYREVDYRFEIEATKTMREQLAGDPRYRVAQVFPEYSTQRVLATEFLEGDPVDGAVVQGLSLDRRNRLGEAYLDLYLRELFDFNFVQTDPHFGNYRVQVAPDGQDRLVLFDFGAMREVPEDFLKPFTKVVRGGLFRDASLVEAGGRALKILLPDDPPDLVQHYVELCFLITEPFDQREGLYDWGASDLPRRVAKKGSEIVLGYHIRTPPQEAVFLDRKLGGTFIFLSTLKCRQNWRELLINKLESVAPKQGL